MCHTRHCRNVFAQLGDVIFYFAYRNIPNIRREAVNYSTFAWATASEDLVSKKQEAVFRAVVTRQAYSSLLLVTVPSRPPWAEVTLRIWVDYRWIISCSVKKTDLQPHSQLHPFTYWNHNSQELSKVPNILLWNEIGAAFCHMCNETTKQQK